MHKVASIVTMAGLAMAMPAHAACWTVEDARAAKVRDLQTLIAVMGARCQGAGIGSAADYDAFSRDRSAIAATSQRLKARFWTLHGPDEGRRFLDSFDYSIGRQYAAVPVVVENCGQVQALSAEAAGVAGSLIALAEIADRHNLTPPMPGGVCGVKLAQR